MIVARHHAIQDLQTIIEKTGEGHKVRVFLQDEAFTKKDKENLAKLQFEALYDPDGYLQIDKNTLVVIFDKEPDNAVMQVIADIAETESIVETKEPAMIFHKRIEKRNGRTTRLQEWWMGFQVLSKADRWTPLLQGCRR